MRKLNMTQIRTTWMMIFVMIITLFFSVKNEAYALPATNIVYNKNILYINKYDNLVNIKDIINIDYIKYNKKKSNNTIYLINDLTTGKKFIMPAYNKIISLSTNVNKNVIISRIANGIKSQETGGATAYYRHSYSSSACGAYQYMPETWGNYMGYKTACDAPSWVQDQRIISELNSSYSKYHDWTKVIAAHLYPAYASHQQNWFRNIPGNPTVMQYVIGVLNKANLTF